MLHELLRHHLDYTNWASLQLLAEAGKLSHEELHRDFRTADKSVLGTLVHVFAADRIWFARVTAPGSAATFVRPEDRSLSVLQAEWPPLLRRWQQWLAGRTESSLQDVLAYKDLAGKDWRQPLWQVVLHVVNHGTHHRGQVSGFLRALGRTPPQLDLMRYYRTL